MSERRIICTICPNSCEITVIQNENGDVLSVLENRCKRGDVYAKAEVTAPQRTLTTLVCVEKGEISMCPVKTNIPVPKEMLCRLAEFSSGIKIQAPVQAGQVVVKNIMGTGADLIACRRIEEK